MSYFIGQYELKKYQGYIGLVSCYKQALVHFSATAKPCHTKRSLKPNSEAQLVKSVMRRPDKLI